MEVPVAKPAAWPLATGASVSDRLQASPRGAPARAAAERLTSGRPTILVVDPCRTPTLDAVRRSARRLAASEVDAVLVDEAADRPVLTAVLRAAVYRDAGIAVWCEVATHDRNRVAVEGDLAALAHLGVSGVVCGVPGADPLDLTVVDTVRLARYAGHLVAVHAGPGTAPALVDAGAEAVIATIPPLGGVPHLLPVVVDDPDAAAVQALALLESGGAAGILLHADDRLPEDERGAALAQAAARIRR